MGRESSIDKDVSLSLVESKSASWYNQMFLLEGLGWEGLRVERERRMQRWSEEESGGGNERVCLRALEKYSTGH